MTTCKAPFILNTRSGKCEMWKPVPPEYCASNDNKESLYSLKFNPQTKKCEGEDKTDPKDIKQIIEFPICFPGMETMPDNWCKSVTSIIDAKTPSVSDDAPPGQFNNNFLRIMAGLEQEEKRAAEKAKLDEAAASKTTNNILIFIFLIFIILGIGIYFFFK
jgi:hypothetical protein